MKKIILFVILITFVSFQSFAQNKLSKNKKNMSEKSYIRFTDEVENIHEFKGQELEIIGVLLSEIKEGATTMKVYAGFDEQVGKKVVYNALFFKDKLICLKTYLFFPTNLAENSFKTTETKNMAADAEKPTYFSVVLFAKVGQKFYNDEINTTEISKVINLETYFSLQFDTQQQAENFLNFIKE